MMAEQPRVHLIIKLFKAPLKSSGMEVSSERINGWLHFQHIFFPPFLSLSKQL
jgi:hypothetical protein